MVIFILVFIFDEFEFHLLVETLQLATAQLFLHVGQCAYSKLEYQHALLAATACKLKPFAFLAVSDQRRGLASFDHLIAYFLQHLDADELSLRGQAGPQFIDILITMFEGIFDLAGAVVVETDDFEEVPLSEGRGTLSRRFWLRLLAASSR